jgi:DNA-binding transcriptional LysR family regulator
LNRLQSFESFVVSIDAGSISAAAERLGTTKSNVSRRIADLEAHLGVRLLNRNPRKLSATPAGTELYDQLVSLLDGLKEVEERIGSQRTTPRGVLRIAAPMSFTTLYLKSLVVALMKEHPDLVIELDCDDRLSDLQTQGHDCAIRFGQLRDSSLIARKIAPNHHLICASPDYLARKGEPMTPEDLKNHDGLHYSSREPHGMWHLEINGQKGAYRVNGRMRCNNGEVLQTAALEGLGLAILPTFMAGPHLRSGALRVVLPQCALPGGSLSVVYVKDRQPSLKLRVLIDAMLAAYHPTPPWDVDIAELLGRPRSQVRKEAQLDEVLGQDEAI